MSPEMTLGNLLNTSNVMRCEKCRFATCDIAAFKKHVAQKHTEYYCFYCNSVSFSEADLQAHLKLHAGTGPFKCPHCGQVYMRRLCLVKHIERLHSKYTAQAPPKLDSTNVPHISVSSASQSVPSQETSTPRPVVRVTVPTPSTTGVRLNKSEQRQKTLDSRQLIASNGNAVPLNGHVQHNRALTVPLPEEVSIPAGCIVEVAEVKTVNGTKELRLRFVAHQENESVKKNTRTTVADTAKVLPSPNIQNTLKSQGSAIRPVNKTTVNKESPSLVPVNVSLRSPNLISKEKCRNVKRTSPEVINLDAAVPSKVSCGIMSSVGEAKAAMQKEQMNFNMTPAVISPRFSNMLTNNLQPENLSTRICLKGVDERKTCIQEHPTNLGSRMTKSVQSTSRIVPMNRGSVTVNSMEDPSMQIRQQELACLQQQQALSLKQSLAAPVQIRTQSECKDKLNSKAFSPVRGSAHRSSPEPTLAKRITNSSHVDTQLLPLTQEVKTEKATAEGVTAKHEGLPVIYSVYSLSHQQDDAQESTQPIVMAEWTNSAGCDSFKIKSNRIEQPKSAPGYQAHMGSKKSPVNSGLSNKSSDQSVKVEKDQRVQHVSTETQNGIHIKEEKNTPAKPKTCFPSQNTASTIELKNMATKTSSTENVSLKKPLASDNGMHNCRKYPTVSLKRVQVGVCKKRKRKVGSKVKIPVPDGQRGGRVLWLMPLRKEQEVKRPCPNQPVVVLNHPEPRTHINTGTLGFIKNTRACATAKCQILKMKLSKVIGKKYVVMGCTVRSIP